MRGLILVLAAALGGCPKSDAVTAGGDSEPPSVREARLPAGWSGEGVLARQSGALPDDAPHWARIAAEVVSRDGDRLLRACGRAGRIKDPALARATAESRARAELARWLNTHEVSGSRPVDAWTEPGTGLTFTLLEMVVPDEWIPGQALP